jgi:endonuclease/exonuclease/phosphatase (EEP) superfamily protein YafD
MILAAAAWLGRVNLTLDALSSLLPVAPVLALIAFGVAPGRARLRPRFLASCGLTVLAAAAIMAPEWVHTPPPATVAGADRLVVVTHNVAVRNRDPAGTIEALLATDADILMLQETDGTVKPYLPRLSAKYPYRTPCPYRCSLVMFSRIPLIRMEYRFHDADGQFGPPLIAAKAAFPDGQTFTAVTLHMPWPLPAGPQAELRNDLISAIGAVHDPSLVIAGDFNLTPWSAAMKRLDRGLAPLQRISHGVFSFPARIGSGLPIAPPILPIDQAFIGPRWTLTSVRRLPRTGSDHYPLRFELHLNKTE